MCSWCSKPLLVRLVLVFPPLRVASSPICKSSCSKAITLSVWLSWNKKRLSRVALPVISADQRFPTNFLPASHSRRSFSIFETISHNHPQCGLSRQVKSWLYFLTVLSPFFRWSIFKTCPSLFSAQSSQPSERRLPSTEGGLFPHHPLREHLLHELASFTLNSLAIPGFYIFWSNNSSNYCQTCETRAQ